MSFLNKLAKGFVRSAVNQVGRDGGKVISNKVYGDRHATPIRGTSGQFEQSRLETTNTQEAKRAFISGSIMSYFFMFIGSLVIFPVGWIYYVGKIVGYFTKKTVTLVYYTKELVYSQDRRYKTGRKIDGFRMVKMKNEVEANAEDIAFNRKKGLCWFILFFLFLYLSVYHIYPFYKSL